MDPSRLPKLLERALAAALLGLLVSAVPASAGIIFPEAGGGSKQAEDIRTLYAIIFVLGLVVFVGVEAVLIWCLVKFRARRGRIAAQIHGNTKLEIGWTVGAAVILVFLTIATFVMLPGIKDPAASDIDVNGNPIAANAAFASTDQRKPPEGQAMNIQVNGKQYVWQFTYPGEEKVFTYTRMYVPVGMTVTLDIRSDDVQHSWWIPELGGKMDALPGYTNKSWFKIPLDAIPDGEDRVVYEGQCAELCGRNHADMLARVIGLRYQDWRAWYEAKAQQLQEAKDEAASERDRLESQEGR
jgi:cytochrome c oxidase subunit 2